MTNEKKELFATLGLIAEESVANEAVAPETPEVEKTTLESIQDELKELDDIEVGYNEVEKASYECIISDLETLNSALAYRNMKISGKSDDVYLESLSTEFGIATEGIKEIAKSGVKAVKSIISKIVKFIKTLFGLQKTEEKVVKSLLNKAKVAGLLTYKEKSSDEDYRKYAALFIKLYFMNSQIDPSSLEFTTTANINAPAELKPIIDKHLNDLLGQFKQPVKDVMDAMKREDTSKVSEVVVNMMTDLAKFMSTYKTPSEVSSLSTPEGFEMGPALVELARLVAKNTMPNQVYKAGLNYFEKGGAAEDGIPAEVSAILVKTFTVQNQFRKSLVKELAVLIGKYLNKSKSAKSA